MCVTVTAIRTSQEKDPSDSMQASYSLLCSDAKNERRQLLPSPLEGRSRFKDSGEGKHDRLARRKQGQLSSDGYSGMDLLECRLSALPLIRREKASSGKKNGTNWVEKKKWHASTMFNKQLFVVVEGAPFLRLPVTGRNHSYTGVHTYTSRGVCVCDSYTVIILDG